MIDEEELARLVRGALEAIEVPPDGPERILAARDERTGSPQPRNHRTLWRPWHQAVGVGSPPPRRRLVAAGAAVVVLRYYGQLSEREIAAVIGRRPGTVKSRLHEARARLANDPRLEPLSADVLTPGGPAR